MKSIKHEVMNGEASWNTKCRFSFGTLDKTELLFDQIFVNIHSKRAKDCFFGIKIPVKNLRIHGCHLCHRILLFNIKSAIVAYHIRYAVEIYPSEILNGRFLGVTRAKIKKNKSNKSEIYYFCGENCYDECSWL